MAKRVSGDNTGRIAGIYAARVAAARAELAKTMQERGLTAEGGWRMYEEVVNTPQGMAFLLRPVHRTEAAPADVLIVVTLD